MPSMKLLCQDLDVNQKKISHIEKMILEAELFTRICNEIEIKFINQYKEYLYLLKNDHYMEKVMTEINFIKCLINDIVDSNTYTLSGIAYYTQTPEELIESIITSPHSSPSLVFPRKLIELHRTIRPELYKNVIKKIQTAAESI